MEVLRKSIRQPTVAGMFYPAEEEACRQAILNLFDHAAAPLPGLWKGGLVPHAGWVCSGQVAVDALVTLQSGNSSPALVVVFGAVHTVGGICYGALDEHHAWQLPTGLAVVAHELQQRMLSSSLAQPHLRLDSRVHRREHSIEVVLPLIHHAWPEVPILPVEVPSAAEAAEVGRVVARELRQMGVDAIYLASSDLTHYGPNYGVISAGSGASALAWAAENDRRLLTKIEHLRSLEIVDETQENGNACGGGAIAALLGACLELGASTARIIRHTNSYEVLSKEYPLRSADNFVGYAAAVVA